MDNIKNTIIIIIVLLLINEIFFSECTHQKTKLIPLNFDPAKINPASL